MSVHPGHDHQVAVWGLLLAVIPHFVRCIAALLSDAGTPVRAGSADECEQRQVRAFIGFQDPTGNPVHTSFILAFRFDDDGQVIDQWLGSNFIEMLAQLGWGFAPFGEPAVPPG